MVEKYIKQVRTINIILLVTDIIVILFSIFFNYNCVAIISDYQINVVYSIVVMIIIVFLLSMIRRSNKKFLLEVRNKPLEEKLNMYKNINLIKFIYYDAITIITCLGFVLSGNNLYVVFPIAMIVLFILNFPNKKKVYTDLDIKQELD
ncbi:MAG: hypothetical protein LBM25_03265 [Bacteroidales bacterium]|jgi:hypothetical protein|nr:hypothetical protein [Bacteroidales bacterium]